MRDRSITEALVRRATATALVPTGDTPYVGAKDAVGAVRIPLPPEAAHSPPPADVVTGSLPRTEVPSAR